MSVYFSWKEKQPLSLSFLLYMNILFRQEEMSPIFEINQFITVVKRLMTDIQYITRKCDQSRIF